MNYFEVFLYPNRNFGKFTSPIVYPKHWHFVDQVEVLPALYRSSGST